MARRAYRRDKNGRFAGANGGTQVTYGKAGGFANKAFASRVAASKGAKSGSGLPPKPSGSRVGKNAYKRKADRVRYNRAARKAQRQRNAALIRKVAQSRATRGLLIAGGGVAASRALGNSGARDIMGGNTNLGIAKTVGSGVLQYTAISKGAQYALGGGKASKGSARPKKAAGGKKVRR